MSFIGKFINRVMAAALEKDIVVIAVDESPFSERAFDCE